MQMFFKMPDKEWGLIFLEDMDLEAQMAAVRSLIRRNREADTDLDAEIDALEKQIQTLADYEAQIAEQIWVGQMQHSVFQDAANSMAAVGMLAPMFEALFQPLRRDGPGRRTETDIPVHRRRPHGPLASSER